MKNVDKGKATFYRDRAESFLKAMQAIVIFDQEAELHRFAVGLLAVHTAIAMVDAVLVHHLGKRSDDDHNDAVEHLKQLCAGLRVNLSGITHFRRLLNAKNHFAYGDKRVHVNEAKDAADHAEKLVAWAYENFNALAQAKDTHHGA